MVEPGRDACACAELAGAELRLASAVDLAVPAAEVAVREHTEREFAAELEQGRTPHPGSQRLAVVANAVPALEEDRGQALELDPEIRLGGIERQVERNGRGDAKLRRPAVCRDLAVPAEVTLDRRVAPHPQPIKFGHDALATSMTRISVRHGGWIG